MASVDFFTVPTATVRVLFVFVVLSHDRRRIVHLNVTAPRPPWQNPFVERVIGSIRRERLDHVIIWNERALRHHLHQYVAYYHGWRTHLSLDKDAPDRRVGQPATDGRIAEVPHVGGLHHHYERRAA